MGCNGSYCNNYKTPCIKVGSICAGWTNTKYPYTCFGHTGLRPSNDPVFADYVVGDVVENEDINTLRNVIKAEIATRKKHVWYKNGSTLQSNNVATGDLIDHPQQNDVASCVKKLNALVNAHSPSDTQLGSKTTSMDSVSSKDLVETTNLKETEDALKNVTTDCICYSDCVGYDAGGRLVCSCYGYCCHYGSR